MFKRLLPFLFLPCALSAFDAYYPQPVTDQLSLPDDYTAIDPSQRTYLPGSPQRLRRPTFEDLLPDPNSPSVIEAAQKLGPDSASVLASFPDLMTLLEANQLPKLRSMARATLFGMLEADEGSRSFIAVDQRTDWEREGLKGSPRVRRDYDGLTNHAFSEIRYDAQGYRVKETLFEELENARFSRVYVRGPKSFPVSIKDLDGNGGVLHEVRFKLDAYGRPLEERHLDARGQPQSTRSYSWQLGGRLLEFKEERPGRIPLILSFDYDDEGRLQSRRISRGSGALKAILVSEYTYDAAGNTTLRKELVDNLPLRARISVGIGPDPRKALKYMWTYDLDKQGRPVKARLHRERSPLSNLIERNFWYDKQGRLQGADEKDRTALLLKRKAYSYNKNGDVERVDTDGKRLSYGSQTFSYTYDAKGNWIERRTLADRFPARRSFDYGD